MPRVVPSQVVTFIGRTSPTNQVLNNLGRGNVGQLAGLIDLIEAIPEELLTMDNASCDLFICSKAHIKQRRVGN